jgi:hypothetical protein
MKHSVYQRYEKEDNRKIKETWVEENKGGEFSKNPAQWDSAIIVDDQDKQ